MTTLRRFIRRHDRIAALLVLAALALRLLMPAGFMPVTAGDGTITVQICTGTGPATMDIAIPGLPHRDQQLPAEADMPCAFAGLAMPMAGGADPLLLAVAVAFVLAIAITRVAGPPLPAPARLRPPLRGPPRPA